MDKKLLSGHVACFLAYAIFGLNIVFCKGISNASVIPPMALFCIRAAGASLLFWIISAFVPGEKIEKADWWRVALASFMGLFVPQTTFLVAMTQTAAVDAAIIQSINPIFTMIFAAFFLKEPVTWKKTLGVLVSIAGIIFLIFSSKQYQAGDGSTSVGGVLWLLLNGISFSLYLAIFRPIISKYSVITFMKWMFLFSLALSLPFSVPSLIDVPWTAIQPKIYLEVAYVVVFATFVAYFLIPLGQQRLRPTLVSMYTYVQPIVAVLISIVIGMDTLTWQKTVAIVLVFAGVALVNRSKARVQSAPKA